MAQDGQSATNADEVAVVKTALEFIGAFNSLDWERFRSFFAADATVFFPPSLQFPCRADGQAEIEQGFQAFFDRKSPPNIDPKQMKPQMLGDVAIVTFHLDDPDDMLFGRRTVIFQRQGSQWLIVHLHASGIMRPAALSSR